MKSLVFFFSALVCASANYPYYAQHVPLIGHNGVPVETPEVQAAKALHFAAHAAASHGAPFVYTGHAVPNVGPDGRPLDTPEVQLAKAAHFIAYNQAAVRNAVGGHLGVEGPIDTPEVQIAKAVHFAAHAEAKAHSGHYRRRRQAGYYQSYAQPQIGQNGVPLDTPEVQALKAQHYAAHAQANTHNNAVAPQYQGAQYQGPQYQQDHHYSGQYGYHIPVIGPNGVPVETPAVQAEKAKHFASYNQGGYVPSAPQHGAYYGPQATYGNNGQQQDTPEVAAARASHLAAHAAIRRY